MKASKKMKKYYIFGQWFKNLHDATKYHLAMYGASNYQASYAWNDGKLEKFKPIKKMIKAYKKEEKTLKGY